jgi:hypothetical protein
VRHKKSIAIFSGVGGEGSGISVRDGRRAVNEPSRHADGDEKSYFPKCRSFASETTSASGLKTTRRSDSQNPKYSTIGQLKQRLIGIKLVGRDAG